MERSPENDVLLLQHMAKVIADVTFDSAERFCRGGLTKPRAMEILQSEENQTEMKRLAEKFLTKMYVNKGKHTPELISRVVSFHSRLLHRERCRMARFINWGMPN